MLFKLKEIRERQGMSQNELAKAAGMSPQNIQKIEQSKSKGVQLETLDKLCEVLECQPGDLLVRIT